MINCPNCGKKIADDSAHCGYCGHELQQQEKKKTMFGMAALSGDDLDKAIQQAEEAKKADKDAEKDTKPGGGLKIPKPGESRGSSSSSGSAGSGLKIPKPGQKSKSDKDKAMGEAKTELLDRSQLDSAIGDEADQVEAPGTEADLQGSAPMGGGSQFGAESPSASQSPEPSQDQPDPAEASGAPFGEPPGPASTAGPAGPQNAAEQQQPPSEQQAASSGALPPTSDPEGASEPRLGEPAGPGPSQVSQAGDQTGPFGPSGRQDPGSAQPPAGPEAQPGGFGDQPGPPAAAPEKKSKKGLIIGIVLAVMVLGGGCVATAVWILWDNIKALL